MHPSTSSHLDEAPLPARDAVTATLRSLRDMGAPGTIGPNLTAGLTVALVALPLNLALAIACGLPPAVGLVTGALAGLVSALLGGSKMQITGPEVALAPITLEIVSRHGVEGLWVATFAAGCLQLVFAVTRIGRLVHAIPAPVLGGFLAAVGLLVFDSQLPRLLGMPAEVQRMSGALAAGSFPAPGLGVTLVGAVVVAAVVFAPRIRRRVPGPLVGLIVGVVLVGLSDVAAARVQPIEGASLRLALPPFAGVDLAAVLPEALALALLASIDSLLCAISMDARTGDRVRTDQELFAQGVANMASACVGGMPVAAAVVRSAAALDAGATTRLAPIAQSILLAVVLFVLAPLVSHIPLVALAGILLVVGYRLIDGKQLATLWKAARFEAGVFLLTAAGILVFDFVVGVAVGVFASLAHFAFVQREVLTARTERRRSLWVRGGPAVRLQVVSLEGPIFFATQGKIDEALAGVEPKADVAIDLAAVTTIDMSGANALSRRLVRMKEEGARIWLAGVPAAARGIMAEALERCGGGGAIRVVPRLSDAVGDVVDVPAPARRPDPAMAVADGPSSAVSLEAARGA